MQKYCLGLKPSKVDHRLLYFADYFDADTNLRSWNHLVLDSGQADAK